jgi:anti-sigma B factor antagonist
VSHAHYVREEPQYGDTRRLAVGGEVDLHATPQVGAEIAKAIESGVKHLILDLTEATFIDSTAIRVLLRGSDQLRSLGGRMEIVCESENVLRVFQITNLDKVLDIRVPSQEPPLPATP